MDGYTYFMFLIGASIIVTVHFVLNDVTDRQYMLRRVLPVFALGGGLSFALYKLYIGELDMTPSSMDFFRGWGVDLSFIAIPTQGKFWLWDMLEVSIPRSGKVYFGDASVWNTTFSLPLILIGFYGLLLMRKRNKYALGILFASLFGIYMAMGPSVKVNSIKPEGVTTPLQAAQYAVMPTGNAILSDNLPGFKSMRASYRWHGLFLIGAWVGLAFFVKQKKNIFLNLTVLISILLATVPPPFKKLESSVASREDALYFDNELLPDLKKDIEKNSLVAFVPYGNDLTLNYVASKLDFRMLNVGGDKNLRMAKKNWPYAMIKANKHVKNEHLLLYILDLLNNGVDRVVLPYFDTLWGVHDFKRFGLVKKRKQQELVKLLMTVEGLSVENRKYYSVVRKNENFNFLDSLNKELCIPPYCINKQNMKDVLTEVGHYENGTIYSTGKEGFLKFGPYNRLNKGKYRFNLFGGIVSAETAWVDIVSNKGGLIHARFELINISSTAEGVLLEKNINIEQDVADLEVRVYVGQMDNLRLDSYSLLPEKI
jgi:hypothetical protein